MVAVVRLHVDDDTYRFPTARDYTGKNVFRVSFERLESLETAQPEKLASGYATDVVWFTKGRALERIGEYDLAMRHYARVTRARLRARRRRARRARRERAPRRQRARSRPRRTRRRRRRTRRYAPPARRARGAARRGRRQRTTASWSRRSSSASTRRTLRRCAAHAALDARYDAAALERAQALVQAHRDEQAPQPPPARARRSVRRALAPLRAEVPAAVARLRPRDLRRVRARRDARVRGGRAAGRHGREARGPHKLEAFLGFTLQVHEERVPR